MRTCLWDCWKIDGEERHAVDIVDDTGAVGSVLNLNIRLRSTNDAQTMVNEIPCGNSIQLYLVTIEGSRCVVVLVLIIPAI